MSEHVRIGVEGFALGGRRTGVGRYLVELAKGALLADDQVRITVSAPPRGTTLPPEFATLDRLTVQPGGTLRNRSYWLASRLGRTPPFERLVGPQDLMFYPNYRWLPSRDAPTVTVLHDLGFRVVPDCVNPHFLGYVRDHTEEAVERSDVIATVSRTVADEVRHAYPETSARIIVLSPGPGRRMAAPPPQDWRSRVAGFDLSPGYLLFVGAIEPRKNLIPLIEAVQALPEPAARRHPLVLVGPSGWSAEGIWQAVERAGERVRYLDYVSDDDLRALYAGAGLFTFPSRYEGFGLPLLEAMAAGVPVACSDIPVLREVAGDAARFFDHRDPDAIAGVLADLVDDETELGLLRDAGHRRVGAYSWERTGAELVALGRQLRPR
jgi:glycosyltransferase involved in cell wall biosynthesis